MLIVSEVFKGPRNSITKQYYETVLRNYVTELCSVTLLPVPFCMNVTNMSVMAEWCLILELVLAYLKSKDWVAVGDAIEQTELTKELGMNVLNFLSEFNFIEFDTSKEKIRITNQSLRLLTMPDR